MSSSPIVVQSEGRGPVVVHGGLFSELTDEGEIDNALWAYNAGLLGTDGQPMRDTVTLPDGSTKIRPRPVWYSKRTLDDLIGQSQHAVHGG